MKADPTFYWFDYETFGTSPAWDRPSQFAGRRTDLDLNPVGEPDVFYCRLPGDYLPAPEACRITGITPELVMREGLSEARFIERAVAEIGAPGTVSVGYNNISFDDEFTRHTLFRNLMEPYAHEWRDGNSRWDLLNVVRLTRALRPKGINWPFNDKGVPVNKLEYLTVANGIEHAAAHDALSDVDATIGIARLLKTRQPRLFKYAFEHRGKNAAATLLNVQDRSIVLMASSTVPRDRHHLAAVVPICRHPTNSNGLIVLDLDTPPELLLELDTDALRHRVFTRSEELGDDPRVSLYTVRINACPVLAPFPTLRQSDAERLGMDIDEITARHTQLLGLLDASVLAKIESVMTREFDDPLPDVDGSLYGGGFLSDADRRKLDGLRLLDPQALAKTHQSFDDHRLDEMLWRYRARNWPDSLNNQERKLWREGVSQRLSQADAPWLDWQRFDAAMADAQWRAGEAPLRRALQDYRDELERLLRTG